MGCGREISHSTVARSEATPIGEEFLLDGRFLVAGSAKNKLSIWSARQVLSRPLSSLPKKEGSTRLPSVLTVHSTNSLRQRDLSKVHVLHVYAPNRTCAVRPGYEGVSALSGIVVVVARVAPYNAGIILSWLRNETGTD